MKKCKYCNTTENLKTDKLGRQWNECNSCYSKRMSNILKNRTFTDEWRSNLSKAQKELHNKADKKERRRLAGWDKTPDRDTKPKHKNAKWRDKDYLYNEYTIERKSSEQIAKELGTSGGVVTHWMKKFHIQLRSKQERDQTHKQRMLDGEYSTNQDYFYKGIHMRSSWEVGLARYFDNKDIKWEYEKRGFHLRSLNIGYLPDFYLPHSNEYIEVKGLWWGDSKQKFETFKKEYPHIKIKLLMKDELKNLGAI